MDHAWRTAPGVQKVHVRELELCDICGQPMKWVQGKGAMCRRCDLQW